jgi:magnesium transporter
LDVIQTQVDELLPLKNKLDLLKKKVMVIKKAITDILNSDQDMAMMYLAPIDKQDIISNKLSSDSKEIANNNDINIELDNNNNNTISSVNSLISDNMDLEMLFENYLNEFEWILSEIEGLLDNITNTEENVVLQLDLLRNRILKFELFLSISSFVVTCGALVTGLFGMNLLSHFENNTSMFYIVTTLMISSMFWTFISFNSTFFNSKISLFCERRT